ncbi:MAG: hypothetical protein ACT4QB_10555 [Gammaproteobacteria bacterium]
MYALAREHMDVNGLYGEIQEEIHHTHDYLAAQTSLDLAHTTTRLTVVATLGLVFALAAGLLGMNILVVDGAQKHRDRRGSVAFLARTARIYPADPSCYQVLVAARAPPPRARRQRAEPRPWIA